MDLQDAREFLRSHHHGVLNTFRKDGLPQLSPVVVALDGRGRVVLSTSKTRAKCRNLRRDPRVTLCVFEDRFFGAWVQVEGTAEVLEPVDGLDTAALNGLSDALRREHQDLDEFRAGAFANDRVAIRFGIDRAGGTALAGG